MEEQVLLEEVSPNGNTQAIVESDGRSVQFYLIGSEDSGFKAKACWVQNLGPAPENMDVEGMRQGRPPMLPRIHCAHPKGLPLPAPGTLRIVWFEECDAAALLENQEILAVIPCWSGFEGFHGYARDCTSESTLCWPLGSPQSSEIFRRVAAAQDYWQWWDNKPWPQIQDSQFSVLQAAFGKYTKYYAIDGGKWPPKALVQFDRPDETVLVTLGVSARAQPGVEMLAEDPSPLRRIELAIALRRGLYNEDQIKRIASYVSAQSSLPWAQYTWLGDGHTLPCDILPPARSGTRYESVLLWAEPPGAPAMPIPPLRGDPVKVLWMIPITAAERAFAMKKSSQELARLLRQSGCNWIHTDRMAVIE